MINVTIHFGFHGTVPIFNDVSQKTLSVLPGRPFVPFWLGVPHLSRFAHLCSRVLTHRLPKISREFICIYEQIAGGRRSAPSPLGELTTLPQTRKSEPDGSGLCGSHATIRTFGVRPGLRCRNSKRVVRRYIDFYCSLGCDVILTSVWGAGVGRRMAGIVRV